MYFKTKGVITLSLFILALCLAATAADLLRSIIEQSMVSLGFYMLVGAYAVHRLRQAIGDLHLYKSPEAARFRQLHADIMLMLADMESDKEFVYKEPKTNRQLIAGASYMGRYILSVEDYVLYYDTDTCENRNETALTHYTFSSISQLVDKQFTASIQRAGDVIASTSQDNYTLLESIRAQARMVNQMKYADTDELMLLYAALTTWRRVDE